MSHVDINLWDFLNNSALRWPDKIAIKRASQSYTYAELKERVCSISNFILSHGVDFQDNAAILSPNCIPFVELMYADARIGVVTELLNWRLSPVRLCSLLEKSTSKILFFSSKCIEAYNYIRANLGREILFVCIDGSVDGALSCERLYEMADCGLPYRSPSRSDTAIQIYSSGTTSTPKAMRHSVKNFVDKAFILSHLSGWSSDEVYMLTSPLFHISCVSIFTCFLVGGTCVIGDPSVEGMVSAIRDDHATRIGVVPSLLNRLLDYIEEHPELDRSSVRYVEYGTAPMSAEQIRRSMKLINCKFLQYYGATETVATITCLLPEHHLREDKLRSVGQPVLGTEIKVVRGDGSECAPFENGEIVTRHPCTITEYLDNDALTKASIKGDWYYTGDIGYLSADGFLYLVDRKNDMIISGGENIYPKEVAACIQSMGEGIKDAVVTGVSDSRFGETVIAAVVKSKDSDITAEDIMEHCRLQLASYKKPRYIYFVDSLPLNDLGKVDKQAIKNMHYEAINSQN